MSLYHNFLLQRLQTFSSHNWESFHHYGRPFVATERLQNPQAWIETSCNPFWLALDSNLDPSKEDITKSPDLLTLLSYLPFSFNEVKTLAPVTNTTIESNTTIAAQVKISQAELNSLHKYLSTYLEESQQLFSFYQTLSQNLEQQSLQAKANFLYTLYQPICNREYIAAAPAKITSTGNLFAILTLLRRSITYLRFAEFKHGAAMLNNTPFYTLQRALLWSKFCQKHLESCLTKDFTCQKLTKSLQKLLEQATLCEITYSNQSNLLSYNSFLTEEQEKLLTDYAELTNSISYDLPYLREVELKEIHYLITSSMEFPWRENLPFAPLSTPSYAHLNKNIINQVHFALAVCEQVRQGKEWTSSPLNLTWQDNPIYLTAEQVSNLLNTLFYNTLDYFLHARPLAQIEGQSYFYNSLYLHPQGKTLNPRSATETLVEAAITEAIHQLQAYALRASSFSDTLEIKQDLTAHTPRAFTIVDVGSGSGCIGASIVQGIIMHFRGKPPLPLHLISLDLDPQALAITQQNLTRVFGDDPEYLAYYKEEDAYLSRYAGNKEVRAAFSWEVRLSNYLQALQANEQIQLLVSNPPYIAADDPLMIHAVDDPHLALIPLDDHERKGAQAYKEILFQASTFLDPCGVILMEHGYQQSQDLYQITHQVNQLITDKLKSSLNSTTSFFLWQDPVVVNDYNDTPRYSSWRVQTKI